MTKEMIHTRPATVDDAPRILTMHRALATHCSYPESQFALGEDRVRATIQHEAAYESYLIAEDTFVDTPEIGGFAYVSRSPLSWNGSRGVYIEDLFVWPELQGNFNIGSSLLAHAAHLALQYAGDNPDSAFLRLDTANRNNDATLRFYEGKGFEGTNTNLRLSGGAIKELANLALVGGRG